MDYSINNKKFLNFSIYIFIGAVFIFLIWLMSLTNYYFSEFIYVLVLVLMFSCFLIVTKVDRNIKIISFSLFFLKLMFLVIYSIGNDIIIFPDSYDYILHLDRILVSGDYSLQNIQSIASTLHVGHYYLMLIPYSIFKTPESIIYLHSLLVSISIVLFYIVFNKEFGKKVALFTLVFSFLSFNLSVFGSLILKDASVVFLSALIIFLIRVKNRPYIAILLSLALFTVRIYAGFAFLAAILFEMVFIKKTSKLLKFLSVTITGMFFVAILKIPDVSIYFDKSFLYFKEMLGLEIFKMIFVSLSKFYFAPLPWNVISNYDVYTLTLFDSIAFLLLSFALLIFIIKFLSYKSLRRKLWIFIIPILVHAVVLGYEYDGDSTRQRIGIFIFLILTLAIGLFYKKETRSE